MEDWKDEEILTSAVISKDYRKRNPRQHKAVVRSFRRRRISDARLGVLLTKYIIRHMATQ